MNHTTSLDYRQVREAYLRMMNEQTELATNGTKCDVEMVWDIGLSLPSFVCIASVISCAMLSVKSVVSSVLPLVRHRYRVVF